MSRAALVVGDGSPGAPVAAGLAARGWTVHRFGDEPVHDSTRLPADRLDLVVHARYPDPCRHRRDLVEVAPEQWHLAADEPLDGAIRLARIAHPALAATGGIIVFLVPLVASAGGEGFAPLATAAEGARILAKSLAKTWGVDGIRAHAVTLDPSAFLAPEDAAGIAEANALHDRPLGRVPDTETGLSAVIEALADDDLAVLTGASLVVDGGLWMPG